MVLDNSSSTMPNVLENLLTLGTQDTTAFCIAVAIRWLFHERISEPHGKVLSAEVT